MLQFKTF